jgi:ubiquinone/menaquinone biosynthesis C-methylase UbiE
MDTCNINEKTEVVKTKIINSHQQQYFDEGERGFAKQLLTYYTDILDKKSSANRSLKILDIGGGAGHFAMAVHEYLSGTNCEIFVVDTMSYDTWTKYADEVTFVKGSADDLTKLFEVETFDLIIGNYSGSLESSYFSC